MNFVSLEFTLFFLVTWLGTALTPARWRWTWLLAASYFFLVYASPPTALILLVVTLITYLTGFFLSKTEEIKRRKAIRLAGILLVLAFLVAFKYIPFLAENIALLIGRDPETLDLGIFALLFPLGISFFVFQAISYILDVFTKKISAELNPGKLALYLVYFPRLASGPIERGGSLLPQFAAIRLPEFQTMVDGFVRVGWGLFKKLLIADRLAVPVQTVFGDVIAASGLQSIIAVFFYSIQIYVDFSAYMDIVLGLSQVLGLKLTENFNLPYFADSVTDFWRRWHITFSTWLRDYIFIPLNFRTRRSKFKFQQALNVFITFLISGLWHGANWTFIVWGAWHGLFQLVESMFQTLGKKSKKPQIGANGFSKALKILFTFALVSFAWIFFRAETLMDALRVVKRIVTFSGGFSGFELTSLGLDKPDFILAWVMIGFFIFTELYHSLKGTSLLDKLQKGPLPLRWAVYIVGIFAILIFGFYGETTATGFIYTGF